MLRGAGGGGATMRLSPPLIAAGVTGSVATLSARLGGTKTFSKVSGAAAVSVASGGAVSLASGLAAGATASFVVRVQNAAGDAIERSFTLTGAMLLGALSYAAGGAINGTLAVSGATGGSTFSSPDLTGATLDAATGALTLPAAAGTIAAFTLVEANGAASNSGRSSTVGPITVSAGLLLSKPLGTIQSQASFTGSSSSLPVFDTGTLEQLVTFTVPDKPWTSGFELQARMLSDGTSWTGVFFGFLDEGVNKIIANIKDFPNGVGGQEKYLGYLTANPGDVITFRADKTYRVEMKKNNAAWDSIPAGEHAYATYTRSSSSTKMQLLWTTGPMTLNLTAGPAVNGVQISRADTDENYRVVTPILYSNAPGQPPQGYEMRVKRANDSVLIAYEDATVVENASAGYATLRGQTIVADGEAGTNLTVTVREKNFLGGGGAPNATASVYRPTALALGSNIEFSTAFSSFRTHQNLYGNQAYFQQYGASYSDVMDAYVDAYGQIKPGTSSAGHVARMMPYPEVSGTQLEVTWDGDPNFSFHPESLTGQSTFSAVTSVSANKKRFTPTFTRSGTAGADFMRLCLDSYDDANPPRNIYVAEVGADKTLFYTPAYLAYLTSFRGPIRELDNTRVNVDPSLVLTTAQRTKPFSLYETGYGISWEEMAYKANATGRDLHINIHPSMPTQHVTDMATFFDAALTPGIKLFVEYSNECWNSTFAIFHFLADQCLAAGRCNQTTHDQSGGVTANQIEKDFQQKRVFPAFTAGITSGRSVTRVMNAQIGAGEVERCDTDATLNSIIDMVMQAPYVSVQPSGGNTPAEMYAETKADMEASMTLFEQGADGLHGIKGVHARGKRAGCYEFGYDLTQSMSNAQRTAWRASTQAADIFGQQLNRLKARCGDACNIYTDSGFPYNWGLTYQGDPSPVLYNKYLEIQNKPQTLPQPTTGPKIATSDSGVTYTATPGVYTNSPASVTGKWRRNGVAITGQTGLSYTKVTADNGKDLYYDEIVTNASGTVVYSSNRVSIAAVATKVGPDLTVGGTPAFQAGASGFGQERTAGYGTGVASDGTDVIPASDVWTYEVRFSRSTLPSSEECIAQISGKFAINVGSDGKLVIARTKQGGETDYYFGSTSYCNGAPHRIAFVANGPGNGTTGGFLTVVDGAVVQNVLDNSPATGAGGGAFQLGHSNGSKIFGGTLEESSSWSTAKYTPTSYAMPSAPYTGNEAGIKSLHHLDGNFNAATV